MTLKSQPPLKDRDLNRYAKGTRFENKIRDDLGDRGYLVVRAAGSKGRAKIDLVAFRLGMPMMLIQAKTSGTISKHEWDRIFTVAGWYPGMSVAVLASNGPKGRGVTYTRLTGLRTLYARSQPCVDYDPGPVIPEIREAIKDGTYDLAVSMAFIEHKL